MKTIIANGLDGAVAASENDGHDHTPELVLGTNTADDIVTGGGPQEILAGNGNDTVSAGGGPDIVSGGNGKDLLRGQGGPDTMAGGNGRDALVGGPGPDALDGGNGADVLIGGVAFDVLTGGNGPDRFVFLASNEAPCAGGEDDGQHEDGGTMSDSGDHSTGGHDGPPRETIADFRPNSDVIDLSALGGLAGLSDGPSALSAWVEQVGDDTILYVDTDGDLSGEKPQELCIVLLDVRADTLDSADFLF